MEAQTSVATHGRGGTDLDDERWLGLEGIAAEELQEARLELVEVGSEVRGEDDCQLRALVLHSTRGGIGFSLDAALEGVTFAFGNFPSLARGCSGTKGIEF